MASGRDGAQSVHRVALLLRVLAAQGRDGCRLLDLAAASGLERPTVHRLLKGLMAEGMVAQGPAGRRYRLGHLVFELGLAAAPRFDLRRLCEPALTRLAERTGDTVFLSVRSGNDSVCLDRKEGSFPIKTLTVDVGTRRPLGVGAGGLALLTSLPAAEAEAVLAVNARQFAGYADLDPPILREMLARAQILGYVLNDRQVTPGAMSLALPVNDAYGRPLAAISIGAIASRMAPARQHELAALLRAEVAELERQLARPPT